MENLQQRLNKATKTIWYEARGLHMYDYMLPRLDRKGTKKEDSVTEEEEKLGKVTKDIRY